MKKIIKKANKVFMSSFLLLYNSQGIFKLELKINRQIIRPTAVVRYDSSVHINYITYNKNCGTPCSSLISYRLTIKGSYHFIFANIFTFSFASAGRTEKLRDEEEEPRQQAGGGHHLPVLLHDLLHQRV